MKTTWELQEDSNGELLVTVSGEIWDTARDKAFKKLAKNVEVDGFRKGSAPKHLIEKQLKTETILMEAVENLAQEALDFGLNEHSLTPVSQPHLHIDELSNDGVTYKFHFVVSPKVTLGAYRDLNVTVEEVTVSEEEVTNTINQLAENYAELVLVEDRAAELDDTTVIDFEGFKDDVAFEGGKGENYSLKLGSNSFIPGFEEQIVGMKTGESKDIEVTFPENYQAEELAGQPAIFKVTVHEIKERVLPEINDDFAKEVNRENVSNLAELKANIETELLTEKQRKAEEAANNEVFDLVADNAEVNIPQVMIDEETENLLNDFKNRLAGQGFPYEQFIEMTGQTEEQLKSEMAKDAEKKVKLRLVLAEIATVEELEASSEEIEAEYQAIAANYQMDVAEVKRLISDEMLASDLKIRKAYDLIKI